MTRPRRTDPTAAGCGSRWVVTDKSSRCRGRGSVTKGSDGNTSSGSVWQLGFQRNDDWRKRPDRRPLQLRIKQGGNAKFGYDCGCWEFIAVACPRRRVIVVPMGRAVVLYARLVGGRLCLAPFVRSFDTLLALALTAALPRTKRSHPLPTATEWPADPCWSGEHANDNLLQPPRTPGCMVASMAWE